MENARISYLGEMSSCYWQSKDNKNESVEFGVNSVILVIDQIFQGLSVSLDHPGNLLGHLPILLLCLNRIQRTLL